MNIIKTILKAPQFFLNRFTNEKSLTQHKEEHAALIQKESENKRKSAPASLSSSGAIGKDANTPNKKEDGKNNGKQANNNSSSGEVKATCPQCNQTFRRKFNLTIHIDRVGQLFFQFFFINTLLAIS